MHSTKAVPNLTFSHAPLHAVMVTIGSMKGQTLLPLPPATTVPTPTTEPSLKDQVGSSSAAWAINTALESQGRAAHMGTRSLL